MRRYLLAATSVAFALATERCAGDRPAPASASAASQAPDATGESWQAGGFEPQSTLGPRGATCSDAGRAWYLVTHFDSPNPWGRAFLLVPGRAALFVEHVSSETVRTGVANDPSSDENSALEHGGVLARWLRELSEQIGIAAGLVEDAAVDVVDVRRVRGDDLRGEQRYHVVLGLSRADGAHTWAVRADMKLEGDVSTSDALLVSARLAGMVRGIASDDKSGKSKFEFPTSVRVERSCTAQ